MIEKAFGIIPLTQTGKEWKVFLVHHKSGNHWAFPKGRPLASESAQESAKRELEEETGLKVVKFLREEPLTESYVFQREGKKIQKTVSYFLALAHGKVSLQSDEIIDGKWVSPPEALSLLTYPEARNLFTQVIQLLPC